ncbi:MAG TPA: V-type ATPase 116kDa subunit family protein, partial [Thermoplasmata archaeon]|nr:V-type ATPase 116kDa subunit family protein [Thermoplasmata archaeon]
MGVLRPVAMSKVGVLGLKDDRERILGLLHDLRIAQIEPLSPEALSALVPERGSELQRRVGDEALRFRGLKHALPPVPTGPPRRFDALDDVLAAARTVPIDAEVAELKREDDRLLTEERALDERIGLLDRLAFYPDRLEYLRARSFVTFVGEAEPKQRGALAAALPPTSDAQFLDDPRGSGTFLVSLRTQSAEVLARVAQSFALRLSTVPAVDGPPAEEAQHARVARAMAVGRRAAIAARLGTLAREWYPTVAAIDEALQVENRKIEVLSKLGAGRETFALEAWIPTRDLARLSAILAGATGDRAYLYSVPTKEEPPTLMDNPKGIRRFEFFIRFYSLPQPTEWDPTLIFAIVFPLLFGLMLADWGYGLTILLICVWMIRGFPGAQYLPKPGRNFVKLIMGPKGMQQLAWALLPGCLLAIGLGLYFDDFFGFPLFHWALGWSSPVDPLANTTVTTYLLIGLFFGLGMVSLGFLLGALKAYFHHHPREMVGKIGGIAFAFGIVFYGLSAIHFHSLLPPFTTEVVLAFAALGVGIALLLVGEGVFGILGLIDIVSHVLSYTRIV